MCHMMTVVYQPYIKCTDDVSHDDSGLSALCKCTVDVSHNGSGLSAKCMCDDDVSLDDNGVNVLICDYSGLIALCNCTDEVSIDDSGVSPVTLMFMYSKCVMRWLWSIRLL